MSPHENRPSGWAEAESKSFGGDTRSLPCIDLTRLSERDREVWDAAYLSGYCAGHEQGWAAADAHAAALHQHAVSVVRRAASLPARDAEADRAAAIRRAERFGQRAVLSGGAA